MYIRNRLNWTKFIVFYLTDIVSFVISFVLAYAIRFGTFSVPFESFSVGGVFLIFCAVMLLITTLLGLKDNIVRRGSLQELIVTTILSLLSLCATTLILFSFQYSGAVSRLLVLYSAVLFVFVDFLLSGVLMKRLYIAYMKGAASSGKNLTSAFLVTERNSAESFLKELREAEFKRFSVKGVIYADSHATTADETLNANPAGLSSENGVSAPEVCGSFDEAARFICRNWIDEVIIYLPNGNPVPASFLAHCREMGLTVHQLVRLSDADRNKQFVEEIGPHASFTTVFNYIAPYQAFFKRAMDIVGGLIGSLCAVLIGIVIGPIIYISSPGPLLFRQKRVGKNGKYFYVLKFRSMVLDAEDRKKDLMTENRVSDGMMFKIEFDPRVIGNRVLPDGTKKTGIGEFIRKTSLDEFPQFFNVLKGDMSLVGTRPPTVDEWEKYEFHHRARLAVKPGITGLWQISGRSEITDFEEVVRLDTEYITHYRISSDIKILLKTVPALLQRKGAM